MASLLDFGSGDLRSTRGGSTYFGSGNMKRILLGGEPFSGFKGDLGKVYYEEQPEEPCILCLRLDGEGYCDGKFKCPYLDDLRRGLMHDCVEH